VLVYLFIMSLYGGDDLTRLDFEINALGPGPQEFVDNFSGVDQPDLVIPTSTFRGSASKVGNLVVISPGVTGGRSRFIETVTGLRVVVTTPDLRGVRVVDINRAPAQRHIGGITVSDLRRPDADADLQVVETKEHQTSSGQQITIEVLRHGLAKSYHADQSAGQPNPNLEMVRSLMDQRQQQEFGLLAAVLRALGEVATS